MASLLAHTFVSLCLDRKPKTKIVTNKLQNAKISLFVKELLFIFITTPWEKTQINPTTYYIYGNKKKMNPNFPLL